MNVLFISIDDPRHAAVVAELSALARAHVAGKTEPTPQAVGS
jgi:hypothetical protein